MNKGQILALVGTSGVGKTSLMKELIQEIPDVVFPIPVLTNRGKRGQEDDIFCRFASAEIISDMHRKLELVQYLEYAGNVYGCARQDVEKALSKGIGMQAYVESGVIDLRVAGYRVVPVNIITDESVYRNEQRALEDEERKRTPIDYQLVLKNSFSEGGLEKAVQQLKDFVLSL